MCLTIGKNQKAVVAKSNITCYKVVKDVNYAQDRFYTLYQSAIVYLGSTYTSILRKSYYSYHDDIEEGLHSLTNLKDARKLVKLEKCYGNKTIVRCTIPKGSSYYRGTFADEKLKSYASDCVVYNEIIK